MSSIITTIATIVSIVLVILLYIFVLPDNKRTTLNKPLRFIHDFIKIKNLMIESIFRLIYTWSVVCSIVFGIFGLFDHFFLSLLSIFLGPIVCRVSYEFILLAIMLVKNVMEINNHLKGIDTAPDSSDQTEDAINKAFSTISKTVQKATEATNNTVQTEDTIKCPVCGKTNPNNSDFCIHCGNKIKF